jgi:histone H3/H4
MARTKSSATKNAGASRTEIAQAAAAVAKPAKKVPAAAAANDDGAVGGGTVSTRIVGGKTAAAGGGGGDAKKAPQKRRAHPGTRALQEIELYQKSTETLVPKAVVMRVVREVIQNIVTTDVERITPGAAAALHEASEMFMVNFLSQANDLAVHAKRVTVMPADVKLAKNIISTYTPIDLGMDHTGKTTMTQYRAERHVTNEKLREERAARREAKEAAARDTVDGVPAAVAAINDEGEKPKRANKKKKRDDAEDDAPVAAEAAADDEPKPAAKRAKKPKVAKEEKAVAAPVPVSDVVTVIADDAPIL